MLTRCRRMWWATSAFLTLCISGTVGESGVTRDAVITSRAFIFLGSLNRKPPLQNYAHYLAAQGRVSTDSRQPQPGTLFFALNGPRFRGADFAPLALALGTAHVVVDDATLAVLGDMFELDDESPAEHHQVGQLLTQSPLLPAVLIGPEMAAAAAVARHAQYFVTKAEAAVWLRQHPMLNRQVLVKGSRGMALEKLVELL